MRVGYVGVFWNLIGLVFFSKNHYSIAPPSLVPNFQNIYHFLDVPKNTQTFLADPPMFLCKLEYPQIVLSLRFQGIGQLCPSKKNRRCAGRGLVGSRSVKRVKPIDPLACSNSRVLSWPLARISPHYSRGILIFIPSGALLAQNIEWITGLEKHGTRETWNKTFNVCWEKNTQD